MDELEDLNSDRTNVYFYNYGSWGQAHNASLSTAPSPPP